MTYERVHHGEAGEVMPAASGGEDAMPIVAEEVGEEPAEGFEVAPPRSIPDDDERLSAAGYSFSIPLKEPPAWIAEAARNLVK